MAQLNEQQLDEIRTALATGKLHAVKAYKDMTGASLLESKEFVESLDQVPHTNSVTADNIVGDSGLTNAQMDKVLDELSQGNKIMAIRHYRDHSGKTLKESKVLVEELIDQLQLDLPKGKGCLVILFLFALGGSVFSASVLAWV